MPDSATASRHAVYVTSSSDMPRDVNVSRHCIIIIIIIVVIIIISIIIINIIIVLLIYSRYIIITIIIIIIIIINITIVIMIILIIMIIIIIMILILLIIILIILLLLLLIIIIRLSSAEKLHTRYYTSLMVLRLCRRVSIQHAQHAPQHKVSADPTLRATRSLLPPPRADGAPGPASRTCRVPVFIL